MMVVSRLYVANGKKRPEVKMFDSKMMVETSEEQPASTAAMMASTMVGRAGTVGGGGGASSSSSDEIRPTKTVSFQGSLGK